jgi:hypothetical protein
MRVSLMIFRNQSHLLLCALFVAIPYLADAQTTRIFRDNSQGVTFSYPSYWVELEQRTGRFKVVVGDKDGFAGSCGLGITSSPQLAKYGDQETINATTAIDIENGARQHGSNIKIDVFERTKIGNRPAIYYESETTYQSLQFKAPLRTLTGMVKVGDRMVVLQCSSLPQVMKANRDIYVLVISSLIVGSR